MTIGRLSALLGSLTLGVGLAALGASWLVLPARTPPGLLADAVLALFAATLAVILGAVFLGRLLLRPFRELAGSVAGQQPLALHTFLHSKIEELVAVATAIERTEGRLTSSIAQIQRDRAEMSALFEHMADGALVLDAQDRVELSNPAACRLLRQVSMAGRTLSSAVHDPDMLQVVATQLPTEQRVLVLLQDDVDQTSCGACMSKWMVSHTS